MSLPVAAGETSPKIHRLSALSSESPVPGQPPLCGWESMVVAGRRSEPQRSPTTGELAGCNSGSAGCEQLVRKLQEV